MSMELVNLKHEEISVNKKIQKGVYFKLHNERECYFSPGAVRAFGLSENLYFHFFNDDRLWYFFVSADDKDGFKAFRKTDGSSFLSIYNKSLVTLFKQRSGCSVPSKYPLRLVDAKVKGCQLILIDVDKPMEFEKYKYPRKPKN